MTMATAPTRTEFRKILIGLCLAMSLSALDQTMVGPALPAIGAEMGSIADAPWIIIAYSVATAIVTPLYGKLADIRGAGPMLLLGILLFVAGSVASALATSIFTLACARALQGLGGAALASLSQTIIAGLVAPRDRGRYQGLFALVFACACLVGPPTAGFLAQRGYWSFVFWIHALVGLLALLVVHASLKRFPATRHPHRIDHVGAALLATGSGLLALAFGCRGDGLRVVVPLLAASGGCWLLLAHRMRNVDAPFIAPSVLGNDTARNAALSGALAFGSFSGLAVVVPIHLQTRFGLPPESVGLAMIAPMTGVVAGAALSGRLMSRSRRYKRPGLIGLSCACGASGFLAARGEAISFAELDALVSVISVGVGAVLVIGTVSLQNAVERHNLGAATTLMQFLRQMVSALMVTLLGALATGAVPTGTTPFTQGGLRLVFSTTTVALAVALLFYMQMEERPLRSTS